MNDLLRRLADTPAEPIVLFLVTAAAAIHVVAALLRCFLGYFVYRVGLVLSGAILFALAPISLGVHWGWSWQLMLAAAVPALAVGGYVFCRFYRVITAAGVFFGAAAAFVIMTSLGPPPRVAAVSSLPLGVNVAFGVLLGLGCSILAYLFVRGFIVVASALDGGVSLALLALAAFAGPVTDSPLPWVAYRPAAVAMAGAAALVLSSAGMCVQFRLLRRLARPGEPVATVAAGPPAPVRPKATAAGPSRRRPAIA